MLRTEQQPMIHLIREMKLQEKKVFYLNGNQLKIAYGDICLRDFLGPVIDIYWDCANGNMFLTTSSQTETTYSKQGNIEVFLAVQFRHAFTCPYKQPQFTKSQKNYKPCACVLLIQENDKILVTRRKLSLNSFPGAWVLPGGQLQKGESLIQGGLRQAQEEVGLDYNVAKIQLDHGIMAWESAFCVQNKIVSSAIAIFFNAFAPAFKVNPQQTQIESFMWKNILNDQDEHKYTSAKKNGYGQAHLNYLSFYRFKNHNIVQAKKWIEQQKNQNMNSES